MNDLVHVILDEPRSGLSNMAIDEALLDERAEICEQVDALTRCDRSLRCVAHACQAGRDVERNGLLQPGRGDRLEVDRDLRGVGRRKTPVHLDHDLDVRADGIAYLGRELDRPSPLGGRERHPGASKRIELERRVTARHDLASLFCECGRIAIRLVPAVRVSPNAVAVSPAAKLPSATPEPRP